MSSNRVIVRSPPGSALLFAVAAAVAGCGGSSTPCERFAELTGRCDKYEKPETTSSICRNAFDRVGEESFSPTDERQARYVRWLNATLRLQAACMADATTCDDYARCRKLQAAR